MKKLVSLILSFLIITFYAPLAYGQAEPQILTTKLDSGIVSIYYPRATTPKVKVMIEKDNFKMYYNLTEIKQTEDFPLQLGNGLYQVTVLENTDSNRYKSIKTQKVDVKLDDERLTFLQSVQSIEWNAMMQPIKQAQALTKGLKSDQDKLVAIHGYIIKNVQYAYDKISRLTPDYLPDIEEIFAAKKGVCYDYAALMAAMLRSVGIPTKLVKGYTEYTDVYHAWNQVYVGQQWQVVDPTLDAGIYARGEEVSLFKDAAIYKNKYEY